VTLVCSRVLSVVGGYQLTADAQSVIYTLTDCTHHYSDDDDDDTGCCCSHVYSAATVIEDEWDTAELL